MKATPHVSRNLLFGGGWWGWGILKAGQLVFSHCHEGTRFSGNAELTNPQ